MNPDLANYLAFARKLDEGSVTWGAMPLQVASCLSSEQPPQQYVSSVRAIVLQGDSVLVIRSRFNEFYILPGGRCEKGESLGETLRRELLEETGWTLKDKQILGFMHFHHLGPKPADYPYPYPDFIWLIYSAQADKHFPEALVPDDYAKEPQFHSFDTLGKLNIANNELTLLKAAIELRQNTKQ